MVTFSFQMFFQICPIALFEYIISLLNISWGIMIPICSSLFSLFLFFQSVVMHSVDATLVLELKGEFLGQEA